MPFALTDHLKTNHKELPILPSDHDKLQALWIKFDVVKDLRYVPRIPGRQPPLPGFKIIPGFSYQYCGLLHSQFPYNAESLKDMSVTQPSITFYLNPWVYPNAAITGIC
ncbi:hypothetical protein M422DRAFT_253656 [Sphaerobolus stellatus SS14]|uniref:Uncharacterized protein n=1 Tax=Sphaerobolus stellatus (strain SS14) TaxID=990650 RepID=A0A0C9VXI9_SPHS4|nr:hypothetical protein M422DRAFT_253656 [Sphaerobolus stellatus SS14]